MHIPKTECSLLSLLALLLLFAGLLSFLAGEHTAPMSLHVLSGTCELLDFIAVLFLLLLDDGLDFAVLALLLFALFVLLLKLVPLVLFLLQGSCNKLKLFLMLAHIAVVSCQSVHVGAVGRLEGASQLFFVRFVRILDFLELGLKSDDLRFEVDFALAVSLGLALGRFLALLAQVDLDLKLFVDSLRFQFGECFDLVLELRLVLFGSFFVLREGLFLGAVDFLQLAH